MKRKRGKRGKKQRERKKFMNYSYLIKMSRFMQKMKRSNNQERK